MAYDILTEYGMRVGEVRPDRRIRAAHERKAWYDTVSAALKSADLKLKEKEERDEAYL